MNDIDKLIQQAEEYNKKHQTKPEMPVMIYVGLGIMTLLGIWVAGSALGSSTKTEPTKVDFVDDLGQPVPSAEAKRLIERGEVTLIDMS